MRTYEIKYIDQYGQTITENYEAENIVELIADLEDCHLMYHELFAVQSIILINK